MMLTISNLILKKRSTISSPWKAQWSTKIEFCWKPMRKRMSSNLWHITGKRSSKDLTNLMPNQMEFLISFLIWSKSQNGFMEKVRIVTEEHMLKRLKKLMQKSWIFKRDMIFTKVW